MNYSRLDSRLGVMYVTHMTTVLWCFVHVCFVQMTILKRVLRSRRADAHRCAHFPTDILSVIQGGEITVEKCAYRGASARQERHTLSLGRNKHGHNNSAPWLRLKIWPQDVGTYVGGERAVHTYMTTLCSEFKDFYLALWGGQVLFVDLGPSGNWPVRRFSGLAHWKLTTQASFWSFWSVRLLFGLASKVTDYLASVSSCP